MAWVPVVVLAVVWVVVVVVAVGPTVVERRPEGALPTRSGCLLGVLTLLQHSSNEILLLMTCRCLLGVLLWSDRIVTAV